MKPARCFLRDDFAKRFKSNVSFSLENQLSLLDDQR